ncbi:MAG: flagellar motor protein MotB [Alphaproteobacteria bacterium]|nr:flagellar motor protein MotB [Alphaproteobacteria bacterium]
MADGKAPIIIIRKKKKGGHGGHHGGAWKVAYADFVTAMMSFFLLLWLLNVTTDMERKGIADYFAPAAASRSESGSGGVFGGQTITSKGASMSLGSPPTTQSVTLPTVGKGDEGDEDTPEKSQETPEVKAGEGGKEAGTTPVNLTKNEQSMVAAMKTEEEGFRQAEVVLKQAIESNPTLKEFANQIVVDRTPEGLRIQITDRDRLSMFPSGGAIPYERARDLLLMVGRVVAQLPNKISVTGHTDSAPFTAGSGRDNWSLSTARANISREFLVKAGVDEKRVARVSGLADRDPFVASEPMDARNRRISIVLLRQAIPPADMPASGQAGGTR